MIRLALLSDGPALLTLLCTYLVHSTVLVALIWSLAQLLGRQPAAANQLWRLALVAPLASTALAMVLPVQLTVGRLPPALGADRAPERLVPAGGTASVAGGAPVEWTGFAGGALGEPAAAGAGAWFTWPTVALALVVLAGLLVLGRLLVMGARVLGFRRELRGRRPLVDGEARRRLDALCARGQLAPVILSVSPRVTVPMALGLRRRREICLPVQAMDGLAPAELDAVLAHELAHLERRDNGWLTVAWLMEAVFFFQPLTGLVRRRLQDSAELACDVRAVELTGSARALARSLAEVASWNLGGDPVVPVSAMAHRGSLLLRRVERLLSDESGGRGRWAGRWTRVVVGLPVMALALILPSVGAGPSGAGAEAGAGWESGEGQQRSPRPMALPVVAMARSVALAAPAVTPVAVPVPKATAAANRFAPRPPSAADRWQGMPMPMPMPMPPLDHLGEMPLGDLMNGLMGENGPVPRALEGARHLAPLAMHRAGLQMQLDALERRRSQGTATKDEVARIAQLRGELDQVEKQHRAFEKRLERDMEQWEKREGKDFEARMEKWGEEFGKRMEKWGEGYGKQMEKWGEQYGKDWERWGEQMGKRMAEKARRDQARRDQEQSPSPAKPAAPAPR